MEHTHTFDCGNSRYEAIGQHGYLVVRRQDWVEKVFIGYAHDIAEVMSLIQRDAKSRTIRARPLPSSLGIAEAR